MPRINMPRTGFWFHSLFRSLNGRRGPSKAVVRQNPAPGHGRATFPAYMRFTEPHPASAIAPGIKESR